VVGSGITRDSLPEGPETSIQGRKRGEHGFGSGPQHTVGAQAPHPDVVTVQDPSTGRGDGAGDAPEGLVQILEGELRITASQA
jgi:hypothetical protein